MPPPENNEIYSHFSVEDCLKSYARPQESNTDWLGDSGGNLEVVELKTWESDLGPKFSAVEIDFQAQVEKLLSQTKIASNVQLKNWSENEADFRLEDLEYRKFDPEFYQAEHSKRLAKLAAAKEAEILAKIPPSNASWRLPDFSNFKIEENDFDFF